jgi:hypothetical protein
MPQAADDSAIAALFAEAHEIFERACRAAGGGAESHLSVAGRIVLLRAPTSALLDHICPALSHLSAPAGSAALNVLFWDSASTGVGMAQSPWGLQDYGRRGGITGIDRPGVTGRWRASFSIGRGVLCLLDTERNIGLYWTRDAAQLPGYERAAPMLPLWNWWLPSQGAGLVHGAAVGFPAGGALLAAPGGSGKSTTALTCLQSPLQYAGDDYCIVTRAPGARIYSLFNSGKVRAANRKRVPHLLDDPSLFDAEAGTEKLAFLLNVRWPQKLIVSFPLRVLVVPRVSGQPDTRVERIGPAAALRALAPSTLFQLSGSGEAELRLMGGLVRSVPCYALHLGTELAQIPAALIDVLRAHGVRGEACA